MATESSRESRETTGSAGRTESGHPARSAMQRAGGAVLGAAASKARSGVRGVANRLDRVASSTTASGKSAAGGLGTTAGTATDAAKDAVKTTASTATDTAKGAATTVTDTVKPVVSGVVGGVLRGVGPAFALVVRKIMLFLQFLRRLALQLLEALRQLALRLREAAARRRGGEQQAVEDEDVEDQELVEEEAAEKRPAPPGQPEGQRAQQAARPRPAAKAADAPARAVRRVPVPRRPERRRGPGAGGAQ
jgi:hypothetical protein